MDETTFSDPEVLRRIEEGFIPVRVDKDRRPDINERYAAGGWPAVAILTPEGAAITRANYLPPPNMMQLLDEVLPLYREKHEEITAHVERLAQRAREEMEKSVSEQIDHEITRTVRDSIVESFDPEFGGFGKGQKFPHPEAIDFALIKYVRDGDDQMRDVVTLTLDNLADGEIHDKEEGGFFRYSTRRDWSAPHFEKLLDSNAGRLYCYLEAYQTFENPRYREVAESTLDWVLSTLHDESTGAFFANQYADSGYFTQTAEERRRKPASNLDRTIFTNWNAMMISALFKASRVLRRPELAELGTKTLDFLLEELYSPAEGMYHYFDETYHLPGLLRDQAYVLRTLIDHTFTTGDNSRLGLACELVETMQARLAAPGGGFYDTRHEIGAQGGLKQRNRSILENAVAAEAIARLGYYARENRFFVLAIETLEAFARDYRTYGIYVAGYARAVDLILAPPVCVTVVGSREDPLTTQLRAAAFSFYMPSRVVQVIDPETDRELLERSGYPSSESASAYVEIPRLSRAQITDPEELPTIMSQFERERQTS